MCRIFIDFPRGLVNASSGSDYGWSGEICNSMSFSFGNLLTIVELNDGPLRFEHCWVFHNYDLSPWGLGMTFSAFIDEASCWVWTLVLNYYDVVWWSHGAKKIHCCEFPVLLTELVKNLVAPWFSHQEIFPSNLAHDINLHASNILKKQSSGGVLWKGCS